MVFRQLMAEYNSIEKLSSFLEDKLEINTETIRIKDGFDHLYCLQSKGDLPPVFNIFGEKLFSGVDKITSRPIYVFAWPGSDGKSFGVNSVEEIAQTYLKQILKINPNGPYYLMGFSFGGLVAFEIAAELQKRGLQAPILILLDCGNPQARVNTITRHELRIKKNGFLKTLTSWIFSSIPRHIKNGIQQARIVILLKSNKRLPADLTNKNILTNAARISLKYSPKFYKGKMHLFKMKSDLMKDDFFGWKDHASDVQKFELKGQKHTDTIEYKDNKLFILQELQKLISEVEGKSQISN
jgi:aspartate racemase